MCITDRKIYIDWAATIDGCEVQHTIGYCANEHSSKIILLQMVQPEWNLWSVGIVGPQFSQRVRHGSDLYNWRRGFRWAAGGVKRVSGF